MIYLSHVKLSYTTLKWHTANKFLCYAFLLVFIRETSKFYPSTYPHILQKCVLDIWSYG